MIPSFSLVQGLSFAWTAVSLLLIMGGVAHNRAYVRSAFVRCDEAHCALKLYTPTGEIERSIPRSSLQFCELVRLSGEKAIDGTNLSRKKQKRLGFTLMLTISDGDSHASVTKQLTTWNMGRKKSRRQHAAVNTYIEKKEDSLEIEEQSSWTVTGVICLVFGVMSLVLSCLLGEWRSASRKSGKKS
jgi:hypothetical protein